MTDTKFQNREISEVMATVRQAPDWNFDSPSDLLVSLEGRVNTHWSKIDDWEEMPDLSVLENVLRLDSITGEVFVISEASYRDKRGAFCVEADELREFAANHLKLFGQSLFNGDTFFFCPKSHLLAVFHHEGVWAVFDWRANY